MTKEDSVNKHSIMRMMTYISR